VSAVTWWPVTTKLGFTVRPVGYTKAIHFDGLSATHPDGWVRLRFDADVVVHSSANPLLAAEIAFGCLHGDVTKKKLDLV